jgi:pyridinium-3,5-bisthiocarboxylic acid mononucleotide nickel chelatase
LRILYFDCFSGAAGDMILGALIDGGVPLEDVRRALGSLAITPDTVGTERVTRAGISATKFNVRGEAERVDHAHDHEGDHGHSHGSPQRAEALANASGESQHHHHGAHRSLAEVGSLIDGSALSGSARARAKELFHTLGEAEAAIHGMPIDKVHFHEVGALDSIVDIVGTVFAIESLRVDRIVSSPLNVGSGSVRSAHGLYPVPAPATMRLLTDVPIYSGPQKAEMVTPTGALLVRSYADEFGTIPAMRVRATGYGAGSRDFADTPNVLRVLIGDADSTAPSQSVVVIEADIDDMNPQIFGALMDTLLAQGALDVFYTSIQMKKNRPGTLLSVIAQPDARERLTSIIFRETTTIGVRYREMTRECLDRETVPVETPLGTIRFKVARRNGEILTASPEFDDCVKAAGVHGRPVKEVQALASRLFFDRQ